MTLAITLIQFLISDYSKIIPDEGQLRFEPLIELLIEAIYIKPDSFVVVDLPSLTILKNEHGYCKM